MQLGRAQVEKAKDDLRHGGCAQGLSAARARLEEKRLNFNDTRPSKTDETHAWDGGSCACLHAMSVDL